MKYAWIIEHRGRYPVARLCRLLQFSRSGYGRSRSRPPNDQTLANAVLDVQVATIHARSRQSYGRPRIVRELGQRGVNAGHERIRLSWKRKSLRPIYKRPYHVTREFDHAKPVAQNVWNRRFDGCATNQAWVANINYVSTGESWLYLEWVMDLGGRKIVGWPMSERMKASLVCDARRMTYWRQHTRCRSDHAFRPWCAICQRHAS